MFSLSTSFLIDGLRYRQATVSKGRSDVKTPLGIHHVLLCGDFVALEGRKSPRPPRSESFIHHIHKDVTGRAATIRNEETHPLCTAHTHDN